MFTQSRRSIIFSNSKFKSTSHLSESVSAPPSLAHFFFLLRNNLRHLDILDDLQSNSNLNKSRLYCATSMPFQVIAIIDSTAVTFNISLKNSSVPPNQMCKFFTALILFLFSFANILTPHPYSCHEMKLWILTLEADILGTPVLRLVVRGPGTEVQRPHGGLWGPHAMARHGGTLAVVAP